MTVLSHEIIHVGKRYIEFGLAKYDTTETEADVPTMLRTIDSAVCTSVGAVETLSTNTAVTTNANGSGNGAILPTVINGQSAGRSLPVVRSGGGSSGLAFSYLFIGRK